MANKIQYLMADHQFSRALTLYDSAAQRWPGVCRRLPSLEADLAQQAMDYFSLNPLIPQSPWAEQYDALIQLMMHKEDRRSLGLRLKLDQLTRASRLDLDAIWETSHQLLALDPRDTEALWWVVLSRYVYWDPLNVPREVDQFRKSIVDWGQSLGAQASSHERGRLDFLFALLAMHDRDWMQATQYFDRLAREPFTFVRIDIAHAQTLLLSGRPAQAAQVLEPQLQQEPLDVQVLGLLAQAYLDTGEYVWAAQTVADLRRCDPKAVDRLLGRRFGLDPLAPDLYAQAVQAVFQGECFEAEVDQWEWLLWLAESPQEQTAAYQALMKNLSSLRLDRQQCCRLLQYGLTFGLTDLINRGGAMARQCLGPRAVDLLLDCARGDFDPSLALAHVQPAALLSLNQTVHVSVPLPDQASLVVLVVQGYPKDEVWPILYVSGSALHDRLDYVYASRAHFRPLVYTLNRPAAGDGKMEMSIGMLNAFRYGQQERSILIQDILVF